jgi:glutathione S-transferase
MILAIRYAVRRCELRCAPRGSTGSRLRSIDLFKAEQYDPRYLKLNPGGIVPTLVHDGKPIIESTLICEYLDDAFPEPPLKPADPWLRARMRLWSKMVDEGLFEGVTELSFSARSSTFSR